MRILFAALMMLASAAYAQSSGGGGSGGSSSGTSSGGGSATMGGGMSPSRDADGGGGVRSPAQTRDGTGGGQQSQVPDVCEGGECEGIGEPTGTGLGNRGIRQGEMDPYDLGDSPVQGGPAITGPTGRELNVPDPGRDR